MNYGQRERRGGWHDGAGQRSAPAPAPAGGKRPWAETREPWQRDYGGPSAAPAGPWQQRLTRTISAYEKIEQIGEGTYGQVFTARCRSSNRIFALKKIRLRSHAGGLPITALREIKILRHIRHPCMVRLEEIVTSKFGNEDNSMEQPTLRRETPKRDDERQREQDEQDARLHARLGNLYLVMEYVEHDLTGLLDHGVKFRPVQIKAIMRQLLEVLSFLHGQGIVHRDIKCSNLLISRHFELKLADFGLARSLADDGRELTNKVITLWYRPPELLLGATRYTAGVDKWSVGCILAELLLGRPLFTAKTELEQLRVIFNATGTPSATRWPAHRQLPHYKTMMPRDELPNIFRQKYGPRMQAHHGAIDLVERLLHIDPEARTSASTAVQQSYFYTSPMPPANLRELGELPSHGLHEFQTKRRRRAEREARQREGGAGEKGPAA